MKSESKDENKTRQSIYLLNSDFREEGGAREEEYTKLFFCRFIFPEKFPNTSWIKRRPESIRLDISVLNRYICAYFPCRPARGREKKKQIFRERRGAGSRKTGGGDASWLFPRQTFVAAQRPF